MFVSFTSPDLSAYAHAASSMQARVRQEEEDARENPVDGPVEENAAAREQPDRVGTTQKSNELPPEEEKQVKELKKRDAEVRRHEQAHISAAGPYAQGPPQYEYQTGPDGKQYAIGGHVKIDTGPVPGDPKATIEKARVVRRAALAPKDPSQADRSIAQKAARMELKARQELELQRREQQEGDEKKTGFQASKPPYIHMATSGINSTLDAKLESDSEKQTPRRAGAGTVTGPPKRLYESFPAHHVDRYA